jgi:hypothetical protein
MGLRSRCVNRHECFVTPYRTTHARLYPHAQRMLRYEVISVVSYLYKDDPLVKESY